MITLTGADLTPEQLVAAVDDGGPLEIAPAARERAVASRATLQQVLGQRPVYGRTTGVGANLCEAVADADSGLRLLRSHAGGGGSLVDARTARALLVVRANQLLAGGAGVDPTLIDALVAASNAGATPAVHEFGAIGTGDLTALAEVALTLIGERPWLGERGRPAITIDRSDALAFLSSSALTIAQATLAYCALRRLADAATVVAALTFTALRGSPEPFAEPVQAARPHAGATAVARRMRELIEPVTAPSGRIQDPYGLRAFAPVQGVLVDALDRLRAVLIIELNAAAENPLVSIAAGDVFHHGNFHLAPLAHALDGLRLALLSSAQLGTARLSALMEPRLTDRAPFLAGGPHGSSGLMVIEYTAASALAAVRAAAVPVTGGNAVLSRGVEEHASFAPQAARQTAAAIGPYRLVLAGELVAATRALRLAGPAPGSAQLGAAFTLAADALPTDSADRALDGDLVIASGLLERLDRPG